MGILCGLSIVRSNYYPVDPHQSPVSPINPSRFRASSLLLLLLASVLCSFSLSYSLSLSFSLNVSESLDMLISRSFVVTITPALRNSQRLENHCNNHQYQHQHIRQRTHKHTHIHTQTQEHEPNQSMHTSGASAKRALAPLTSPK